MKEDRCRSMDATELTQRTQSFFYNLIVIPNLFRDLFLDPDFRQDDSIFLKLNAFESLRLKKFCPLLPLHRF